MKIWQRSGKRSRAEKKAPTIEHIAVFGFADTKPEDKLYKSVVEVTKVLAEAGYVIVDGGGPGVMQAASVGGKAGGGEVIGVTFYPSSKDPIINFEGRDPKNPIDREIKTDSYVERTLRMMKEGQVYVVFKGGTGTISEFGMAWGLARLYFGHHKPLILYGKFWKKIIQAFKENMALRPSELKVFKIVETPDQVLDAIKDFEIEIARGDHGHHLKTSQGDFSL